MSEEKIIEEAVKLTGEAKAPGVFSILNVLKERAYPKDKVNVFLDEQSAYDAAQLQDKITELSKSDEIDIQNEIDSLITRRDIIVKYIEENKYVFHITGISEGKREELYELSINKFPLEFDESKNPFTGELIRTEKDNKERDRYFTNLLWSECIEKIIDNNGNEQFSISVDDISVLRDLLPIAATGAVTQSIEKLRISTAMFMATVDEDFLAKS